jgi:two-component system, sensor histidine kinase and response regulator
MTRPLAQRFAPHLSPCGDRDHRSARITFGSPTHLDTAENGRVAVEMFKTRRYDLVLVDVNMPVLDGYSAVAAMRGWEREQGASPTPILALTGRAMVEDRVGSIEAGCNGHLTKPLRSAVLMEVISRFTNAAHAD